MLTNEYHWNVDNLQLIYPKANIMVMSVCYSVVFPDTD